MSTTCFRSCSNRESTRPAVPFSITVRQGARMTSLTHDRRGSGPPLLLIHGIGSHWQVWHPLLPALAPHRDVIAIDLPGFGTSPIWPPTGGGAVPGSVSHL